VRFCCYCLIFGYRYTGVDILGVHPFYYGAMLIVYNVIITQSYYYTTTVYFKYSYSNPKYTFKCYNFINELTVGDVRFVEVS